MGRVLEQATDAASVTAMVYATAWPLSEDDYLCAYDADARNHGIYWIDRDGNEKSEDFGGLWATCVQHEIDHLDGKLFIDYLSAVKRQMITRKMVKLKRERAREES